MNTKSRRTDFRSKKTPVNCIAAYRQEEGLSLSDLGMILGSASYHSAKNICASVHPSKKLIHILASREGISVSEFRLRYAPVREDAA